MAHYDLLNYPSGARYGNEYVRHAQHYVSETLRPIAQNVYNLKPAIDTALIVGIPLVGAVGAYGAYADYQTKIQREKDAIAVQAATLKELEAARIRDIKRLEKQAEEEEEMRIRKANLDADAKKTMVRFKQPSAQRTTLDELLSRRKAEESARTATKIPAPLPVMSSGFPSSSSSSSSTTTTTTSNVQEIPRTVNIPINSTVISGTRALNIPPSFPARGFPSYDGVRFDPTIDYTRDRGGNVSADVLDTFGKTFVSMVNRFGIEAAVNDEAMQSQLRDPEYGSHYRRIVQATISPDFMQQGLNSKKTYLPLAVKGLLPAEVARGVLPGTTTRMKASIPSKYKLNVDDD